METEAIIRTVVAGALALLQKNPDLLDQFACGLSDRDKSEVKILIGQSSPITVYDGWPSGVPKMPSLAVIPGESEEADQVVGSFFGEDIQTNPTIGTLTTVGSFFSTTHHVVVYSNNSMFCSTLGYAVMWALIVGRRLLEAQGLREMRIIRGPTDIAKEVSAPDAGTDNVFRTSVHLVHKWPLTYTDLEEGQLIDEVRVITNDFGNPGNNNAF